MATGITATSLACSRYEAEPTVSARALEDAPLEMEVTIPSPDKWLRRLRVEQEPSTGRWRFKGTEATFDLPLPEQVALPFEVKMKHCYGFLVNPSVLVTAAHCFPGPPHNGVEFTFKGAVKEFKSSATCVWAPLGSGWKGSDCDKAGTYDRALCYLDDGWKLAGAVSTLSIAKPSASVTPVSVQYHGQTTRVDPKDLTGGCFPSPAQSAACLSWSGSPAWVQAPSGRFAGVGLLSVGASCQFGNNNTSARFSSIMDDHFLTMLRDLETKKNKKLPVHYESLP
jgi:hypothetical protein